MFIVAKYKNLTNTAKYIYIYIKLHTWPSIESNEITVSFREEEIKNFPSRVNSTSFHLIIPPLSPFDLDEYVDRDEAKYRSRWAEISPRWISFKRSVTDCWILFEFSFSRASFSPFLSSLATRSNDVTRPSTRSIEQHKFQSWWDRVTRNRVNNRVKM